MFADDVLQCPCGGRRSVDAIVTDTALARSLLARLGLATSFSLRKCQPMRVISSTSISTTGFFTLLFCWEVARVVTGHGIGVKTTDAESSQSKHACRTPGK